MSMRWCSRKSNVVGEHVMSVYLHLFMGRQRISCILVETFFRVVTAAGNSETPDRSSCMNCWGKPAKVFFVPSAATEHKCAPSGTQ